MKLREQDELKVQRIEDVIEVIQPSKTFVIVGSRNANDKIHIPEMLSQLQLKLSQAPSFSGIQITNVQDIYNTPKPPIEAILNQMGNLEYDMEYSFPHAYVVNHTKEVLANILPASTT